MQNAIAFQRANVTAKMIEAVGQLLRSLLLARRRAGDSAPYQRGAVFGVLVVLTLLLFVGTASAERIVLANATVHTVSGDARPAAYVVIENGKIVRVSEANATAADAEGSVVDLKGMHLYPGLIALDTTLGLTEIGAVRSTRDETETGDFTPDVESWISVNPSSELIPVTRANGVAFAEPSPQGGIVGGQSSLIVLDGWTTEQLAVKRTAALHLFWPETELDMTPKDKFPGDKSKWKSVEDQAKERDKKIKSVEDFFYDAKAYAKAKQAAGTDKSKLKFTPAWEAMIPYVKGELPVMVHANDVRQIKSAVKWAQTNEFKIVIVGGRDAWMATNELAAAQIPVVLENIWMPTLKDFESYNMHFKTPSLLHKAGVKVALGVGPDTFDAPLTKNLPYFAAQAIAFGLPEDEALKGITLYPAEMMGVADKLGTIEAGKEATLVAVDGSIFDLRANVKHLWIAGKEVSLENRHTRLYEKYKNRPKPNL